MKIYKRWKLVIVRGGFENSNVYFLIRATRNIVVFNLYRIYLDIAALSVYQNITRILD